MDLRAKFIIILYIYLYFGNDKNLLAIMDLWRIIISICICPLFRGKKSTNNSIRDPITVRYLEFGIVRYLEVAFL